MQIFERQLYLNPTSDTNLMASLAFSCADPSVAILPVGQDPIMMSVNPALIHSHELISSTDVITPRIECFFSLLENCISASTLRHPGAKTPNPHGDYLPMRLEVAGYYSCLGKASYTLENSLSAAENFISLAALTLPDTADMISLLKADIVEFNTGIRFSIEVPLDTVSATGVWIIDTDQAESLSITVNGMGVPLTAALQVVTPMLHCQLWERRDYISTGRRICIVNKILIV